ncbi:hypothetical protein SUBVAR_05131 [Subdoligranulum variabile DSM 15176]|uniref:Uncharacterized protein n=1 Tax=Subdoligranulum variabile DSM 15176 TaxID=411471 RepID=D1PL93_9FIRM|nr:hypothetical protein SUBVAR_05131 [Subdoligranulum variabile DSM 15176]
MYGSEPRPIFGRGSGCAGAFPKVKSVLAQKDERQVVKNAQKGPLEQCGRICQGDGQGAKSSKCRK